MEDLTTVMDEYPYIKQTYHKIVNTEGEEVDYEDGKEEDLTPEEKKRIESYEETEPVAYYEGDAKVLAKTYI